MDFLLGSELITICKVREYTVGRCMLEREQGLSAYTEAEILAQMTDYYHVMKQSVAQSLTTVTRSMGGLIGGEASKVNSYRTTGKSACGALSAKAVAYAMGVLEVNASMGLIIAAPTGGSSGVIPGALLALQEEYGFSDDAMVEALFAAGAIGYLIMTHASVSGAECGCQAEVGSASAMAATAVVQLLGGTPEQGLTAAAFALSNLMGLVCDPVAGLVEVPCHSRNAIGASNALICAEIALSGVCSPIPFDEVVEAMYAVGRSLPYALRETGIGGIAGTPTGHCLKASIGTFTAE